jgi:hypothetical protein
MFQECFLKLTLGTGTVGFMIIHGGEDDRKGSGGCRPWNIKRKAEC